MNSLVIMLKLGIVDTGTWDGLACTPMDRGKLREPAQEFDGLGYLSDRSADCMAVLPFDRLIDVD